MSIDIEMHNIEKSMNRRKSNTIFLLYSWILDNFAHDLQPALEL